MYVDVCICMGFVVRLYWSMCSHSYVEMYVCLRILYTQSIGITAKVWTHWRPKTRSNPSRISNDVFNLPLYGGIATSWKYIWYLVLWCAYMVWFALLLHLITTFLVFVLGNSFSTLSLSLSLSKQHKRHPLLCFNDTPTLANVWM